MQQLVFVRLCASVIANTQIHGPGLACLLFITFEGLCRMIMTFQNNFFFKVYAGFEINSSK